MGTRIELASMPVLVIRLELKPGKVCFMFIFLTKSEVLLFILLQFLKVISANANTFSAYRQLQQEQVTELVPVKASCKLMGDRQRPLCCQGASTATVTPV